MKPRFLLILLLFATLITPKATAQYWFETDGFTGGFTLSMGSLSIAGDKNNPEIFERTSRNNIDMNSSVPEIGFYVGYGFRENFTGYIRASFGFYDENLDSYGTLSSRDFGLKYNFRFLSEVAFPYLRGGYTSNVTSRIQAFNPERNTRTVGKYTARGQHLGIGIEVPFYEFASGHIEFAMRRLPMEGSRAGLTELPNPMITSHVSFGATFYFKYF